MLPKARILCVGHDPMLLQTRKWMLEGEFEVEIADTVPQALELLAIPDSHLFDLILLCHSLNDAECKRICDAVFSEGTNTRVLQLNEGWRDLRTLSGPLDQVSAARPQTLLQKISELARGARNARSPSTDLGDPC
jgi:CheY-like chemotaxis protein